MLSITFLTKLEFFGLNGVLSQERHIGEELPGPFPMLDLEFPKWMLVTGLSLFTGPLLGKGTGISPGVAVFQGGQLCLFLGLVNEMVYVKAQGKVSSAKKGKKKRGDLVINLTDAT